MARFSMADGEEEYDGEETRAEEEKGTRSNVNEHKKRGRRESEEEDGSGRKGKPRWEGEEEKNTEEEEDQGGEEGDEEQEEEEESGGDTVKIDLDVLDCSICFEKLRPPLFQCQNGHEICSLCCTKLNNKCHVCSHVGGFIRCLKLEKVIESVRIPCSYSQQGCRRFISFKNRAIHEERCFYSPCFCPYTGCSFQGSTRQLSVHFCHEHQDSAIEFCYNRPFTVYLLPTEGDIFLHGEDGHLFIILKNSSFYTGSTLSITCIRPNAVRWDFKYRLTTHGKGSCLQLEAKTTNMKKWMGVYPTEVCLLVPHEFCTSSRKIAIEVCIQRIRSPTA